MKQQKLGGNTMSNRKYFARYWQLYAMMVIPLVYFIVFKYVPMFGNVLAFRRYRPGMGSFGTEWVGLKYFERFSQDPAFWRAFRNTLLLSLLNLIVNFPIPIMFAILVNEVHNLAFKKVVQTVSYMPRFISTVVVIAILGELLSPSSGIFNLLRVRFFGQEAIYFMNDSKYFRLIYILVDTWQYTGWTAIIYLAAITGIPADLYEAATIDGANKSQQIWFITIPSIMPTIMVMLILNVGRLLSLGFEKVLLMYTPDNSMVSDIIDTLVYRTGLANQNYSYATAIGLFSGIIGIILVAGSNTLSKRLTGDGIY
jgi:putative aldouronate transport system permease protein